MSTSPPLDLVIFGGAGDLSMRKLLPALYMAHLHNNLPEATRIHAVGRQPWDRTAFLSFVDVSKDTSKGDASPTLAASNEKKVDLNDAESAFAKMFSGK